MSADNSARVVLTALGANLGVAAAKFVAAAITGSASLLAEGVHSVADSGNQVLLLIGGRRSRRAPSALHTFGYARQRYVYAFLVAVVLFTLGGLSQNHRPAPADVTAGRRGGPADRHGVGGLRAAHRGPGGQSHPGHPRMDGLRPPRPRPGAAG